MPSVQDVLSGRAIAFFKMDELCGLKPMRLWKGDAHVLSVPFASFAGLVFNSLSWSLKSGTPRSRRTRRGAMPGYIPDLTFRP